jgi:hypothetical protein
MVVLRQEPMQTVRMDVRVANSAGSMMPGSNLIGRLTTVWQRGIRHSTIAALLLALPIAGCAAPNAGTTPTASITASPVSLTSDCPQPGQPAIQPGASLTLQPNSGPVGTRIAVAVTGLQPDCHLWLGLTVEPCTCETGGVVEAAPRETAGALQWIGVDDAGTVRTIMCLCGVLYAYTLGYPPYPSVTPPAKPGGNVQAYRPSAGDHFYITIAGATIADPPPLYALFTVTN